jgi:hypothetical protein
MNLGKMAFAITCLLLVLYWFRYTCLLALRTKPARSHAPRIADANRLHFLRVQELLAMKDRPCDFDKLRDLLLSDYRLLSYLVRHGYTFQVSEFATAAWLLKIDFLLMQAWYSSVRLLSISEGREPLREMGDIIGHIAHDMGERAAQRSSGILLDGPAVPLRD